MVLPEEIYRREEALRTSLSFARQQHHTAVTEQNRLILTELAAIEAAQRKKSKTRTQTTAIKNNLGTRTSHDTTLYNRLGAIDPAWQAENAKVKLL